MQFNIDIPDNMFFECDSSQTIELTISDPIKVKWNHRDRINKKLEGVYVIFDMLEGEDWHTPNPPDLSGFSRKCLYVGEGSIWDRLDANKNNYGLYAGEIVYYEIPNKEERLVFEKILIKHYQPINNKENYNYPLNIQKKYYSGIDNTKSSILKEMNDTFKSFDMAKEFLNYLYDELNWSLNDIEETISLESKGEITDQVRLYQNEIEDFNKRK